jgi:hypothetical protein
MSNKFEELYFMAEESIVLASQQTPSTSVTNLLTLNMTKEHLNTLLQQIAKERYVAMRRCDLDMMYLVSLKSLFEEEDGQYNKYLSYFKNKRFENLFSLCHAARETSTFLAFWRGVLNLDELKQDRRKIEIRLERCDVELHKTRYLAELALIDELSKFTPAQLEAFIRMYLDEIDGLYW